MSSFRAVLVPWAAENLKRIETFSGCVKGHSLKSPTNSDGFENSDKFF